MNKPSSLRSTSSVIALLLAASASSAMVACNDEPKKEAWSCTSTEVPMGEAVRCSQSAVTSDGPATSTLPGTSTTPGTGGTRDGFPSEMGDTSNATAPSGESGSTFDGFPDDASPIVYECGPDVLNPSGDCPPPDAEENTTDPSTDAPADTTGGGTRDGFPEDTTGGSSSGGSSTGGSSSGGSSSGGSTSSGGTSPGGIPTECQYVPELPYCPPGSGGTQDGFPGDGSTPCDGPPGQCAKTPDGSSSSGGSSSGGSSSGGGAGNTKDGSEPGTGSSSSSSSSSSGSTTTGGKGKTGRHYTCTKDKHGNKECVSTPECVAGTKPAKCGACVPEGEEQNDCKPTYEGGCWVTGGGFLVADSTTPAAPADGHDNFGGNAKPMKDGSVKGHWNHVDHGTGGHLNGHPEYIVCRHVDEPGPGQPGGKKGLTANQAYFGGKASWSGADGYWFDVVVKDHGEPGSSGPAQKKGLPPDTYHLTVRLVSDPINNASGTVVYELHGDLEGGNIQMHAPNGGHPAGASALPQWVSYEP